MQHHKTEKDQLLATWSRAELVHREEDFRSFETVTRDVAVSSIEWISENPESWCGAKERCHDGRPVSAAVVLSEWHRLTTTTYKDINHVIEAKETVRRIVATKGHGAQGYNITGSPLTTQVLQSAALSSV